MTDPMTAHAKLLRYVSYQMPGADELADDVRALLELLTPGVLQIAIERRRQIVDEGFAPEGDMLRSTQLFDAAGEYATAASVAVLSSHAAALPVPFGWTLASGFWKPKPRPIPNAVRAGALLAAGIEALYFTGEHYSPDTTPTSSTDNQESTK